MHCLFFLQVDQLHPLFLPAFIYYFGAIVLEVEFLLVIYNYLV